MEADNRWSCRVVEEWRASLMIDYKSEDVLFDEEVLVALDENLDDWVMTKANCTEMCYICSC